MLELFGRRPTVAGAALLLGGLLLAAPSVSWAGERCTTKPMVCARLKAERAQRVSAPSSTFEAGAVKPAPVPLQAMALSAEARCKVKPSVCARLRNESAARGQSQAPAQLASYSGTTERCTSKPMVCARLKNAPGRTPITMANEPGPSSVD